MTSVQQGGPQSPAITIGPAPGGYGPSPDGEWLMWTQAMTQTDRLQSDAVSRVYYRVYYRVLLAVESPRPATFPACRATSTQPTPAEAALMNEADFEAWRQDFLRGFAEDLAELRRDPEAWAEYQAEGELTSVSDGIG